MVRTWLKQRTESQKLHRRYDLSKKRISVAIRWIFTDLIFGIYVQEIPSPFNRCKFLSVEFMILCFVDETGLQGLYRGATIWESFRQKVRGPKKTYLTWSSWIERGGANYGLDRVYQENSWSHSCIERSSSSRCWGRSQYQTHHQIPIQLMGKSWIPDPSKERRPRSIVCFPGDLPVYPLEQSAACVSNPLVHSSLAEESYWQGECCHCSSYLRLSFGWVGWTRGYMGKTWCPLICEQTIKGPVVGRFDCFAVSKNKSVEFN